MANATYAKNVWVDLYECKYETFTATAAQTDFIVTTTPLLDTVADVNNVKFHRVYVNGEEVVPTSVTGSTKTYVIAACALDDMVEIYYPTVAKTGMRIQQGIEYSTDATTDDVEELNSPNKTTSLVSRSGSGSLKLLRNDKTEIGVIETWADGDTPCMIRIKDSKSALAKAESTILLEVKFTGVKGSVAVGGKHEESFNFVFKPPVEVMAVT